MRQTDEITVAELELRPVVRVAARTPIAEVAQLLVRAGVDTLLVDTVPAGEVTEHDVVRALARGHPAGTPVVEIVQDTPMFTARHARLHDVVETMLLQRRQSVVVVEGANVVGLLMLPVAVAALLDGPPWLGALRIALRIDTSTP